MCVERLYNSGNNSTTIKSTLVRHEVPLIEIKQLHNSNKKLHNYQTTFLCDVTTAQLRQATQHKLKSTFNYMTSIKFGVR